MTQQLYFWVYIQKNWKWNLNQYFHTNVCDNIIHDSQKVKTTPVSINS